MNCLEHSEKKTQVNDLNRPNKPWIQLKMIEYIKVNVEHFNPHESDNIEKRNRCKVFYQKS